MWLLQFKWMNARCFRGHFVLLVKPWMLISRLITTTWQTLIAHRKNWFSQICNWEHWLGQNKWQAMDITWWQSSRLENFFTVSAKVSLLSEMIYAETSKIFGHLTLLEWNSLDITAQLNPALALSKKRMF